MRYGVRLPNSGPFASREALVAMTIAAENLGYDAVLPHDHVNWGYDDRYHFYAGSREAADAQERPTHFYEAMTTMNFLAGITKRIRLIPSALCLAWRPVLLVAREALTLHQLSQGRFVLCLCVGNVRRDFEVTGTPWEERGRIAVEKLRALREVLYKPSPVSFEGEYVKFKDAELDPKPEGLKIWWAGSSNDIAIRRAARYADGLMGGSPEYFREKAHDLYREAEKAGRGDVKFEFACVPHACVAGSDEEARKIAGETMEAHDKGEWMTRHHVSARRRPLLMGSPRTVAAGVQQYKDAGVTLLGLGLVGHTLESLLEQMEMFAKEVMPLVE